MKNNPILFLVPLGIILAVLAIIYGGIMPYSKSSAYISGLKQVSSMRSTEEFKTTFGKTLNHPSPIGQEEITKYLASDISGIVEQSSQEDVSRDLAQFIVPYLFRDNVRHLLAGGQIHAILWQKYKKQDDYLKAVDYFNQAYALAPKLPPVLYGLLQLYQAQGDRVNRKRIGEEILKYWPDDENVKKLLAS